MVTKISSTSQEVLALLANKNASDVVFFRVDLGKENKGFYALTIKELYKRRKEPFPAKIEI